MRLQPILRSSLAIPAALAAGTMSACSDTLSGPEGQPVPATLVSQNPPPSPLVDIALSGGTLRAWPFNGVAFDGTPNNPVNLVFTGDADPLGIRATLLALDGDRGLYGLPNVAPFNCTWSDAFGGIETAWSQGPGWTANPIQLQCGAYGPIRFHLRLFPAGAHTIGNAHIEILIPGTTEHQVVSWELAEQVVVIDLLRSGLLAAAPGSTGPINPAPGFRDIPALIYNALPDELKLAIGGPSGPVTDPVPILTDGQATVLTIAQNAPIEAGVAIDEFTVPFDQVIPRPFCSAGDEFVHVLGNVDFYQRVEVLADGRYEMLQSASGELAITPINPLTGNPIGPTYGATISNLHEASINSAGVVVQARVDRQEHEPGTASQRTQLSVTPAGVAKFVLRESC